MVLFKLSRSITYVLLALFEEASDLFPVSLESLDDSSSTMTPIACKSFSTTMASSKFCAKVSFTALFMNYEMLVDKVEV